MDTEDVVPASSAAAAAAVVSMEDLGFGSEGEGESFPPAGASSSAAAAAATSSSSSFRPPAAAAPSSSPPSFSHGGNTLHLPAQLPLPAGTRVHAVRLPKIVSAARVPFDAATYNEAAEDAELREGGRFAARESLIRWRFKRDAASSIVLRDAGGAPQRESNSHIVEWSDGSQTLHVGRDVFALTAAPTASDHSTLFASVKSAAPQGSSGRRGGEAGGELVLAAVAPLTHRVALRALETGSGAAELSLLERRTGQVVRSEGAAAAGAEAGSPLAGAPGAAGKRTRTILMHAHDVSENPEAARQTRIAQGERMSAQIVGGRRRGEDVLRAAQSGGGGGGGGGGGDFQDDDAAADEGDLAAIKRGGTSKRRRGGKAAAGGVAGGRRPARKAEEEEEEEDGSEEDEEDSGSDDGSDSSDTED